MILLFAYFTVLLPACLTSGGNLMVIPAQVLALKSGEQRTYFQFSSGSAVVNTEHRTHHSAQEIEMRTLALILLSALLCCCYAQSLNPPVAPPPGCPAMSKYQVVHSCIVQVSGAGGEISTAGDAALLSDPAAMERETVMGR